MLVEGTDLDQCRQYVLGRVRISAWGCWIWTLKTHPNGYGNASDLGATKRKKVRAHRLSYEAFVGPIPDDLTIDHLCGIKTCVNPAHLDVCTASENTKRYHASVESRRQRTRKPACSNPAHERFWIRDEHHTRRCPWCQHEKAIIKHQARLAELLAGTYVVPRHPNRRRRRVEPQEHSAA